MFETLLLSVRSALNKPKFLSVILSGIALVAIGIGLMFTWHPKPTSKSVPNESVSLAAAVQPANVTSTVSVPVDPIQNNWDNVSIELDENIKELFSNLGIRKSELKGIVLLIQDDSLMYFVKDGRLDFLLTSASSFTSLRLPTSFTENVLVTRESDNNVTTANPDEPELRLKTASGIVQTTFNKDALKSKLSAKQIKEYTEIFSNDLNFKKDVKKGDYFSAIYETYYKGDKLVRIGDIVAAEYISQGKAYRAIRYKDINGKISYYTPSGANLQRAFMRNPIPSSKVTSHFAASRVDPVSQLFSRPHKGTDFKASTGTPIKATGDGKIIFAGTKNGYGNTIVIQHDGKYKTLYAHMDHFAKGMHTGTYVKEGEVIGYVGSTGRVTGPHLHYEFLVDGAQNNPLTAIFPRAKAITNTCKAKFNEKAQQLMEMLAPLAPQNLLLAKNGQNRLNGPQAYDRSDQ